MMIVNVPDTPTISLLFGGYNGRTELNFEKWAGLMQKGLDVSGRKGLVIGSTIAIWEYWNDITGSTSAEKYQMYRNKAAEKFGNRFLDLYDLFFGHALDYCLAAGYYTDKTAEELAAMEDLLEQHILPAEMSYDYAHEGNVHPSKEGYYVIAKLIYDRLIALKYI
jgi:lysophospholipase L1-like esterase